MAYVATSEQTRQLEAAAVEAGTTWHALMERAGRAVADVLINQLQSVAGRHVLVLVGPGNNGGDGLVIARHLHDIGARVILYIAKRKERPDDQPWRECRQRHIPELQAQADPAQQTLQQIAQRADLIVDGLLGIGVSRPLEAPLVEIVRAVNMVRQARAGSVPLVAAIDVPTGINADTGAIMGEAIAADLTIATGILKRGHLLGPGSSYAGIVYCVSIGLPTLNKEMMMIESLDAQTLRAVLPARPSDSHKGTFGKVMVVAGAGRYPGAAYLTASGALRSGAGLVTLACGRSIFGSLAAALHETTFLPLPEEEWGVLGVDATREVLDNLEGYQALVIGPGLGREDATRTFLERLLKLETGPASSGIGFLHAAAATPSERSHKPSGGLGFRRSDAGATEAPSAADEQQPNDTLSPLVIDADGLNLLSAIENWWEKLPPDHMVLTPHPGEMARLLKLNGASEVNSDRIGVAQHAAQEWQQIVVLKGPGTVIAAPDGRTSIGPAGNPALATAGTGDVLAGLIGGLLAQGLSPYDAARLGVFLHAEAGQIVRYEIGEAGAVAGDLLPRLPQVMRRLRS